MPVIRHDFSRDTPVVTWQETPTSPEVAFRSAEQIVEDEMSALTRSDAVARGAPPPRHRGPDGSPRGMGWIAFAGAAALGLLWLVFKTVSTFLEVLP